MSQAGQLGCTRLSSASGMIAMPTWVSPPSCEHVACANTTPYVGPATSQVSVVVVGLAGDRLPQIFNTLMPAAYACCGVAGGGVTRVQTYGIGAGTLYIVDEDEL